jgi:5-methylcytosine-specific restriction protein B
MHVDEWELNARRLKYRQIDAAQQADADRLAEIEWVRLERAKVFPVGLELLRRLQETSDLESVRRDLDVWSRQKVTGFGGFGAMFINQLAKLAPDENEVSSLVTDALTAPADPAGATEKIGRTVTFTETIKKAGQPAPKRIPFVLSYFWWMQEPLRWPCMWNSAEKSLVSHLGWLLPNPDLALFYLDFREVVLGLDDKPENVEHALYWFDTHRFVGLDRSLVDRCRRSLQLRNDETERPYPSEQIKQSAELNSRALLADLQLLGAELELEVAGALGRSVKVQKPGLEWKPGVFRGDSWVDWRLANSPVDASIRVWVTVDGTAVGLYPGWVREGWYDEAAGSVRELTPEVMQFMDVRTRGVGIQPSGRNHSGGEFLLGRWYPGSTALDRMDFRDDVIKTAAELQPAIDRLIQLATGTPLAEPGDRDEELAALVKRFMTERHYPTEKDDWHRAERETMADLLVADQLPTGDIAELRSIWNSNRYGGPGPQSVLNTTLRDADPAEIETFLDNVSYLLWGKDGLETRVNRTLDPGDRGVKGLGESVVMKLLAIAHPDRFLPVYPYTGDMGKVKLMRLIGLEPPDQSLSRGERHVLANDAIRHSLDPFFPGDPWGQGQFLYWLNSQAERPPVEETDVLGALADELLVDKVFLLELVELLREKKQIVFYGPPGTGKTYLAWKLAAALAPEPTRRMLVQFHPSTSYEDFFEGYRPEGGADGQLTYRLVPGPLALMANRAQDSPGIEHVMVIDEINRANLPKVLGELLFLLEYREERVPTLYRAEEAFELPPDLLFIGTMNTADRSIALIDAALRRRFHFIPFFPDAGAMADLLDRWLEAHDEPAWVGDLVKMVNRELIEDLGGPHLQIGPSYFMQKDLTEDRLRRIWTYSVFPFIEDQLFGDADRLKAYEHDRVRARFKQLAGSWQLGDDQAVDESEELAEPET